MLGDILAEAAERLAEILVAHWEQTQRRERRGQVPPVPAAHARMGRPPLDTPKAGP